MAAGRLAKRGDDVLKDSLKRARAALKVDGQVADCDTTMPARLLHHAWTVAQDRKSASSSEISPAHHQACRTSSRSTWRIRRRTQRRKSQGRHRHRAWRMCSTSRQCRACSPRRRPETMLPESRRQRIESLLTVLKAQRFFSMPANGRRSGCWQDRSYSFVFDSCTAALAAYRERLPKADRARQVHRDRRARDRRRVQRSHGTTRSSRTSATAISARRSCRIFPITWSP